MGPTILNHSNVQRQPLLETSLPRNSCVDRRLSWSCMAMSRLLEMPLQSLLVWPSRSNHPWQTEPPETCWLASAALQVLQVCHVLLSIKGKITCCQRAIIRAHYHSRLPLQLLFAFAIDRSLTLCCRPLTRALAASKQAWLAPAEGAPGRAL